MSPPAGKFERHSIICFHHTSVERPAAWGGQLVDPALDRGVIDQGGRVMRLDPGVDHQRPGTAPVFLLGERVDSINVGCGVRTRERDPDEVPQARRDERTVVNNHDQREGANRVVARREGVGRTARCRRPNAAR